MKRICIAFIGLMFAATGFSQQEIIAKWTFPTGNMSDTLPDLANALNTGRSLAAAGGASSIQMKNGATTKAAQASGWENGKEEKSWLVEVNTSGFDRILVSSRQTGGGNEPGPRDFKLEYRLGTDGVWTSVPGGLITVANDWTTGVLENIQLPDACNDQPSVFIRWLMSTNLDINGNEVLASGKAKIDDVVIAGQKSSGITRHSDPGNSVLIYPNPCRENLHITSETTISRVAIYTIYGSKVADIELHADNFNLNTGFLESGRYLLIISFDGNHAATMQSFIKN